MPGPADLRLPPSKNIVLLIQDLVARGEFARGSRLPPERELSTRFQVSRSSLREALSVLQTLGLLRIEPGIGTFVSQREKVADRQPWRLAAGYSLQEVYQFRFVVEGYAARLAATRVNDSDMATLRDVLNQHKEAAREMDMVASAQHDYEFHRNIMVYSGNSLFPSLYASYRPALVEGQLISAVRQGREWEFLAEHENILRTIGRHDPEEASYFMHLHITRAAERIGVALNEAL
jgi:GntR family transcriptional regulator, transcriptional repressor for pyruvate dehydrogenase complex